MMVKVSLLFLLCVLTAVAYGENDYQFILNMMSQEKEVRRDAARRLLQRNDIHLAPAMVDVLFYMPRAARNEMIDVLEKVTADKVGNGYYEWVEYVGKRNDLTAPEGYIDFKASLLSRIDPAYKKILYGGVPLKIRAEEIVWGGVRIDGIPPIDAPVLVSAKDARLKDDEKVFGLALRGEARAYPLRYLSWHEMLNDRVAGEPITVSY
jgi:hypothetical protein